MTIMKTYFFAPILIYLVLVTQLLAQDVDESQDSRTRSGIPAYFPDAPGIVLSYVTNRPNWYFAPNAETREPRNPIENRLDYYEFAFSEGPERQLRLMKRDNFLEVMAWSKRLNQISDNIKSEREKGLGKKEYAELEQEVLAQIERELSKESQQYLWQFEIFLDGPVYYLLREDIAADLELDEKQQRRVKQAGEDAAADYQLKRDAARKQFFISMFDQLSEKETEGLEKEFSLEPTTVAGLYGPVTERDFPYFGQMIPFPAPRGRDSEGQPRKAYPYPEQFIGVLIEMFSVDQTGSDAPGKVRDELPLAELDGPKLKEFRSGYNSGNYRATEYVPAHFFPRFVEALERLGPELSGAQSKLYELMMYGTDEIDGITYRPKEITFDDLPRLTPERLARKSREFGRSLLTEQKQIGMDLLLLSVGPMRMMLCDPVSKQLGLDEKRRQELVEFNAKVFLEYQFTYTRLKHEAFLAVMQPLSPSQREKIEQRTGVSIDELAKRYSVIEEFFLLRDLRLQGLEPIKNR